MKWLDRFLRRSSRSEQLPATAVPEPMSAKPAAPATSRSGVARWRRTSLTQAEAFIWRIVDETDDYSILSLIDNPPLSQ